MPLEAQTRIYSFNTTLSLSNVPARMSETETAVAVPNVADDPLVAGSLLGVTLGVLERFLVHFELTTLAVGLGVVGVVLAGFGDRSSTDVGRALTAVGAASIIVFQALSLIFG